MKLEIERKFLVRDAGWRGQATARERLRQGYLANTAACSIRVRRRGRRAFLSIKGMSPGRARPEYEYEIPGEDAAEILSAFACGPLVEKVRHQVPFGGGEFEVDEFAGDNEGLVLAEIELESAEGAIPRPPWLGDEVTDDARFRNHRLAEAPFARWPAADRRDVIRGRRPGSRR